MKYNLSEIFVCKGQACRRMHSNSQMKKECLNNCLLAGARKPQQGIAAAARLPWVEE